MKYLEKIIHAIVPHEKNGNIPHLLKKELVVALSVLVIMLFYVNQNNFAIIRGLNLTAAIYPAVIADLTNKDRASEGMPHLAWNSTLERAARLKAEDMVKNGYFAHTSPAGVTPWFWLEQAQYNFIYAGENLAIDFTESVNVQDAWLASPTHRDNVLSKNFTEIGITAIDGYFEGRNTTFVVEFFGKPQTTRVAQVIPKIENVLSTENTEPTTPEVAGASTESTPVIKPKTKTPIKIVAETTKKTEKFISVENTDTIELITETEEIAPNKPLSAWYMRLAVNPTNAIKSIYITILGLVFVAMTLMLLQEYQKHHLKHLMMGGLLMALTGVFLYFVNSPVLVQAFG